MVSILVFVVVLISNIYRSRRKIQFRAKSCFLLFLEVALISNANWSRKRISSRTTWPPSRFIWFCWYQTLTEVEDYCFESHVIHSWLRRLFNQILTEVEVYQFESHGLPLGLCSCRYPTLTEVEEGYHVEPHDLPLGFCGCVHIHHLLK